MPAGFFVKLFLVLFLIGSGFTEAVQAKSSPRIRNEKFVMQTLRTLAGAQMTFMATAGNGNFGTFEELGNIGIIDSVLATGEKYSYRFTITIISSAPNQPAEFRVSAVPQRYGKSGKRSFFIDQTAVLRGADRNGEPATVDDPPIDE